MPLQRVDQHEAEAVEGVGPEQRLQPVHPFRGGLEPRGEPGAVARDPVGDLQAAVRGVARAGVGAGRHGDQVRRGRLREVPRRRGQPVALGLVGDDAVRDADPRCRHGDGDVVESLVGRLVVDRVPRERAERLLHRPGLAVRRDLPAGGVEVLAPGRRRGRLGRAGVVDLEHVPLVLDHGSPDDEVLAGVLEGHVGSVEGDRRDLHRLTEVELQVIAGERGAERDRRVAFEGPGLRRPRQVEVVVQRVDARITAVGVDRVLDRLAEGGVERRVVGIRRRVGLGGQGRRRRTASRWPTAPGLCRAAGAGASSLQPATRAATRSSAPRAADLLTSGLPASAAPADARGGSAP